MLDTDSCDCFSIEINGKTYNPIKYGEEKRWPKPQDNNHRCHDCGIKPGGYHHPGCDVEECPACHGQIISCGCLDEE
jgi:hypothetical protein